MFCITNNAVNKLLSTPIYEKRKYETKMSQSFAHVVPHHSYLDLHDFLLPGSTTSKDATWHPLLQTLLCSQGCLLFRLLHIVKTRLSNRESVVKHIFFVIARPFLQASCLHVFDFSEVVLMHSRTQTKTSPRPLRYTVRVSLTSVMHLALSLHGVFEAF
jgi:hypothetical protein